MPLDQAASNTYRITGCLQKCKSQIINVLVFCLFDVHAPSRCFGLSGLEIESLIQSCQVCVLSQSLHCKVANNSHTQGGTCNPANVVRFSSKADSNLCKNLNRPIYKSLRHRDSSKRMRNFIFRQARPNRVKSQNHKIGRTSRNSYVQQSQCSTCKMFNQCGDESGWCLDMTSTHGTWRHAEIQFLLPGVRQRSCFE